MLIPFIYKFHVFLLPLPSYVAGVYLTIRLYVCVVVGLLYFVPAGLYCAYNNLGFVNLQHFDPTTYFLLLQFRVVVTGVVFQVMWKNVYFSEVG